MDVQELKGEEGMAERLKAASTIKASIEKSMELINTQVRSAFELGVDVNFEWNRKDGESPLQFTALKATLRI
jgi:hypothetical protein